MTRIRRFILLLGLGRMRALALALALGAHAAGALAALPLTVSGCRGGVFGGTTTAVTSKDGRHKIDVPMGWSSAPNLHDQAELGAEDKIDELYAIVISEPKASFSSMTLEKFSDTTRGTLEKRLKNAASIGPRELQIHGRRAIQYEVSGTFGSVSLVYLHTVVETNDRYNQILAWTIKAHALRARPVLDEVIGSFDETRDGGR